MSLLSFDIVTRDDVTIVTAKEVLDPKDSKELLEEIDRRQFRRKRVYVLHGAASSLHKSRTMRNIADLTRRLFPGWNRVAFVSDNEVVRGLANIYRTFRDDDGTETRSFSTLDAAMTWMSTQTPPDEEEERTQ